MNVRKQAAALLLCLILAASLVACQRPGATEGQTGQQTEQALQTDPDHFYEEVEEGLLIDAVVEHPEGNVTPKVYVGRKPAFNQERLQAFLSQVGDPVVEVKVDRTEDQLYNFDGVCANGGHAIILQELEQNSRNFSMSYNNLEADRWYGAVLSLDTGDYIDVSGTSNNTYLFTEPKNFSFATEQEAETAVREMLQLLDVGNLELKRTLYLDHEALATAERSELIKGKNAEKGDEIPSKESWTEADDAYMFDFNCAYDGIPMLTTTWSSQTEGYAPVNITVRYNRVGITYLVVQGPLNFDQVAEEPASITSAAEALAVAKEVTQNVVSSYERVIDRVSLRYYVEQDRDRLLLKPCWEVAIRQKDVVLYSGEVRDEYVYVVVDALTGKEK